MQLFCYSSNKCGPIFTKCSTDVLQTNPHKRYHMVFWFSKPFAWYSQLKSAAKPPNRKLGHISANFWWIHTKLAACVRNPVLRMPKKKKWSAWLPHCCLHLYLLVFSLKLFNSFRSVSLWFLKLDWTYSLCVTTIPGARCTKARTQENRWRNVYGCFYTKFQIYDYRGGVIKMPALNTMHHDNLYDLRNGCMNTLAFNHLIITANNYTALNCK